MGILNGRTRSEAGIGVLHPSIDRPGLEGEDPEADDVQEGKQTKNTPHRAVAAAFEDFEEGKKDAQKAEQAQGVKDCTDQVFHARREHENLRSGRVGGQIVPSSKLFGNIKRNVTSTF
jgi:hypothetical protein